MFGDILSDVAAMLTGRSACCRRRRCGPTGAGLYEPVHGSAPDIAGQGKANPLATILSVGMMFRYTFGCDRRCGAGSSARCNAFSNRDCRTRDILPETADGLACVGTVEMGRQC